MNTIPEEAISAWLDHEASAEDCSRIEAAMAADPKFALRVARLARVERMLAPAFAETLESAIPRRIEALFARPRTSLSLRGLWSAILSPGPLLAAGGALAIGFLAGGALLASGTPAPGFELTADGDVIANAAFSARLASVASGDVGEVRVTLSLRDASGRFCRQFNSAASVGLACLDAGDWRVEALSGGHKPAAPQGGYVMADGGADPTIAAALARVGVSELLDREQEARAIASGWK